MDLKPSRFHSTGFPYKRGPIQCSTRSSSFSKCFHSTGFPYKKGHGADCLWSFIQKVSIQLVSPTRGDLRKESSPIISATHSSFHSTGFPYKRGLVIKLVCIHRNKSVSIQLVSPTRGDFEDQKCLSALAEWWSFHSTGFPYKRGRNELGSLRTSQHVVSIQLVSPTRGDKYPSAGKPGNIVIRFPFN